MANEAALADHLRTTRVPSLAEFIAAPKWRRGLYRRYADYPPDDDLPASPEKSAPPVLISNVEFVYFIQARDGAIKIGRAKDVQRRMASLQTGQAYPLKLLLIVEGGRVAERGYHRLFAEHRLHGEWFSPHPDIFAEVERLGGRANPGAAQ